MFRNEIEKFIKKKELYSIDLQYNTMNLNHNNMNSSSNLIF